MSFLTSKTFWADTTERALKTFAQSCVAILTGSATGLLTVNYVQLFSVAGLAAAVSVLTSLASGSVGSTTSASLVVETKELK